MTNPYAAWNADIARSRNAYAVDMARQNGLCATCCTRPRQTAHSQCLRCQYAAALARRVSA